ncbi:methyl-accepting chemotaxis protein [Halobiforma haloterrestris]|uniref:Methyl-accepting chemotaxis protein n=1 Tax=Natronobacterium haloterrestre TaxID=148448 RepID=A0A1I1D4P1_NATHA|nr:methyl-accepting chemotaxis protein [Halobiforma haloterrestris]SFB69989.1 methyl-accepting chemotaxis protein [Halobiforma haloterrestris]
MTSDTDGGTEETVAQQTADSGGGVVRRLVPDFVRRSYRAKFVITILAVLIVISLVGGIGYVEAERTVETDAEQQLTATVDMHADSIDEWMISMESHTRSLSSNPALAGTDAETAEAHVVQEQAKLPVDVRAVHVVDTNDGQVLTSTNGELRGASVASLDEPWTEIEPGVDLTAANDVWHSPTAYADETVEDQVISFASPVEGDEARIAVVVGTIEYRVDGLRQLHDDQETMIVDTDGETVLASDDLRGEIDRDVVADLGNTRDGTAFERDDDSDVVAAYAATGNDDWVAVTTVPAEQAFAASNAVGWTLLSVIGTGLVALLAAGFVLARQTVTPLEDLRNRARRMEEGDRNVDLDSDRIDEVGRLYRAFDEMRSSLDAQITAAEEAKEEAETSQREAEQAQAEAETAREEAEAERERIASVMDELQRVADQYGDTMRAAADGDLTVRATVDTDNEQMREIGEEFNAMLGELEDAVGEVKRFATDVAAASEQVTASSEEVKTASEQVSESVQEISDVAERQSERLGTIQTEMSGLSASTEEIASTASEVARVAERTVDSSERGRGAAQDAIDEMSDVEAEAERAVEAIRSLETEVERIDELVEAISDVADQTSLLALNASIEAAGAGNEGDGFAVVANEVKSLSADAKEAAAEIEERIETIRERTDESVDVVEATSESVREGTEAVEPAVEALEEITTYAEETSDGVQEISAATDDQADSAEEVVTAVDDVAASSEESAAEAGNVSAAAEEQTASLTEVSESVGGLADQAAALSDRLERFETDREPTGMEGTAQDRPAVDPSR